jgi:hypothetical protein
VRRVLYLVGGEGAGADELHGLGHLEGVAEVCFGRHGQLKQVGGGGRYYIRVTCTSVMEGCGGVLG